LPRVALDYLQLVGPAVLTALAAVNVMVVVEGDGPPTFHIGIEWVAVLACLAITAWRKNLLLGLIAAVGGAPLPLSDPSPISFAPRAGPEMIAKSTS